MGLPQIVQWVHKSGIVSRTKGCVPPFSIIRSAGKRPDNKSKIASIH